ncbi:MAG TPA: ISAs1 family transposase [Ktedonobacterales bacterium]|nr:ISAs1 family transposase [Ktedonobacterales bacterium]
MSKTDGRRPAPEGSLRAALQTLPDVRRGQGKVHPLDGMLALAVCALLCGCRSLYAISQWGRECEPELRVALGLRAERGPSVATLHRAFRRLDHAAFEGVLGQWFAAQGLGLQPDEALAIDGKTLRGIHGEEISGVHLVAAYAHQTRVVLAQAETMGKGHELAGVRAVLAALPTRLLAGRVVTGDALLATRALCRQIVRKGGTPSSS